MLQLFKYQLPFKKPLQTSTHTFSSREGIILSYTQGNIIAYGEAAPLSPFSTEQLSELEAILQLNRELIADALKHESPSFLTTLNRIHNFPSLAFALDMLTHDLKAKRSGHPFFNALLPGKPPKINCNALITLQDVEQVIADIDQLVREGFSVFKIKVGIDFKKELRILKQIRNKFPQIKIRLDANGAWDSDEAIQHLNDLQHLNIEYCEQPVSANNLNALAKVRSKTKILLAADESVRNKMHAIELIKAEAVDVLIIKPSLFGEFKNIFVTKELADSHNIDIVITTAFESAIARAGIANLAAAFGSKVRSHGLGTGFLFNYDVGDCSWLNSSSITIPDTAGLGIKPDIENLKEI